MSEFKIFLVKKHILFEYVNYFFCSWSSEKCAWWNIHEQMLILCINIIKSSCVCCQPCLQYRKIIELKEIPEKRPHFIVIERKLVKRYVVIERTYFISLTWWFTYVKFCITCFFFFYIYIFNLHWIHVKCLLFSHGRSCSFPIFGER